MSLPTPGEKQSKERWAAAHPALRVPQATYDVLKSLHASFNDQPAVRADPNLRCSSVGEFVCKMVDSYQQQQQKQQQQQQQQTNDDAVANVDDVPIATCFSTWGWKFIWRTLWCIFSFSVAVCTLSPLYSIMTTGVGGARVPPPPSQSTVSRWLKAIGPPITQLLQHTVQPLKKIHVQLDLSTRRSMWVLLYLLNVSQLLTGFCFFVVVVVVAEEEIMMIMLSGWNEEQQKTVEFVLANSPVASKSAKCQTTELMKHLKVAGVTAEQITDMMGDGLCHATSFFCSFVLSFPVSFVFFFVFLRYRGCRCQEVP